MKFKLTALIVVFAAMIAAPAAQAHTTDYNMQQNISYYEQIGTRAVYMFGVSGGQWTAEICSNHYRLNSGFTRWSGNTETVLQGGYSGNISGWSITYVGRYPYSCDPSTFGQVIPFRVRQHPASFAKDETIGDAGRAAEAKQKSLCGGPWNWVCTNDTDPWPACHNTGVNQYNQTQWQCFGGYDEAQITTGTGQRHCNDTIGVGPYGGITSTSVTCSR